MVVTIDPKKVCEIDFRMVDVTLGNVCPLARREISSRGEWIDWSDSALASS